MQLKKVAVSTFLLGMGAYIWLPTADEIVIHPAFGLFLSYVFNIPLPYGLILSIIIYRGVGTGCLLGSLAIGGKPAYRVLKAKLSRKRLPQAPVPL